MRTMTMAFVALIFAGAASAGEPRWGLKQVDTDHYKIVVSTRNIPSNTELVTARCKVRFFADDGTEVAHRFDDFPVPQASNQRESEIYKLPEDATKVAGIRMRWVLRSLGLVAHPGDDETVLTGTSDPEEDLPP